MYPATAVFKDAILAPSRRTVGRVTFDITDVTAYNDVSSITVTAEASISDETQIVDRKRQATYLLATLENDRFRLDGSYSFPDDVLINNGEVGFVSSSLCGSDGTFGSFPTITIIFGSVHSSAGVTITFDTTNNEYATDFNISAYDASDVLITSVDITGNTSVVPQPLGQLLNYKKLVLTLKKWSVPFRRARVLEVDFGIIQVYSEDNLMSMGLVEDLDLSSSNIPAAEFTFEVDNSDRAFNILNPSGFYKYLQQRQKITAEIGVEIAPGTVSYIPMGQYILAEWISNEGSLTASFTARTNLDLMSSYSYENLTPSTKTLAQLATDIFAVCGITNYSLDPSLTGTTTNSLVKLTSCKDVLQMIAIAGCCNVFVTRDNVIKLQSLAIGVPVDEITADDTYAEPQIFLEKITKQVDVTYWTNLSTSAIASVTAAGITDGDTLALENNTLINTSPQATTVANWILSQKNKRARYAINWRGDPSQELGDVIAIENSYGSDQNAIITKLDLSYEGYLKVKTEARGVPN